MTVGEKLQKYRKDQGLSQEELAQKLLVSRQTISLWENDQTLPTVDNLIRLKEIFGVSIDQILCETEEVQPGPVPLQRLDCTLTTEEAAIQRRKVSSFRLKKSYTYAVLVVVAFLFCTQSNEAQSLFFQGLFFVCFLTQLIVIFRFKKQTKANYVVVPECRYSCWVYSDHVTVSTVRNDVCLSTYYISFDQIKHVIDCGAWFAFEYGNFYFPVRKEVLEADSPLKTVMEKDASHGKMDQWRMWSIVIFVLTLCALPAAISVIALSSGDSMMPMNDMWLFFVFLPIPLTSVFFGFMLKKKGRKWKKNVIAGLIVAGLLSIYGSFSFIFSNIFLEDPAYVTKIEEQTGIDIPEFCTISTQDYTKGSQSGFDGYIYYVTEIRFDDNTVTGFEQQIRSDVRWQNPIKSENKALLASSIWTKDGDYTAVYNLDRDEFNTMPTTSGTFHMISLHYNAQSNKMTIVEYEINFVK